MTLKEYLNQADPIRMPHDGDGNPKSISCFNMPSITRPIKSEPHSLNMNPEAEDDGW